MSFLKDHYLHKVHVCANVSANSPQLDPSVHLGTQATQYEPSILKVLHATDPLVLEGTSPVLMLL